MRRRLYRHRRVLFGGLFLLVPVFLLAAFEWRDALVGLMAILAGLLLLEAASVALAVGIGLVRRGD